MSNQLIQQYNRPERPKTLDTQSSDLQNQKQTKQTQKPETIEAPISIQLSLEKHPQNLDLKSNNDSATTISTESIQKINANHSNSMPFDEQEEWKKISEIMANFGTDTHILQDSILFANPNSNSNSNRRREQRIENGRSNSIAGFTFNEIDKYKSVIKYSESMTNNRSQRKSGSQSPNSQLRNFLCENQLDDLYQTLHENGYDDIDFIKGILEESDLDLLDVKIELRQKLMTVIDSDLQKPARAISKFSKSTTSFSGFNSMNPNNEKLQNNTDLSNDLSTANNINNNNYSTIPKQKSQNSLDSNGILSVDAWLNTIRLPQYAEVFR